MSLKKADNLKVVRAWLTLFFLFLPASAHALALDYYTYGGFSDVVSAFTKCALIFSDNGYMVLAGAIFIGSIGWGIFKTAISKLYAAVPGEGGAPPPSSGIWGVLLNSLMATALFTGLVLPKGTLHIYDKTENQYQAVGGIPLIGVVAAGISSGLERALIQMVETSGDPLSFSKQAGIKGVQVLNGILARGGESPDDQGTLGQSIDNYIKDCVTLEIARTGTTLTIDEIKKKTSGFVTTSFPKASNPAAFTVVYDPSLSPQGEAMSCTAAWANISARTTQVSAADQFKGMKTRACKDGGYSVYDADPAKAAAAYTECVSSTDALVTTIDGGWNLNKLIIESMFARRFLTWVAQDSPELPAQASKVVGLQSQLAEFLQGMATKRGVMVALAAVALPFICLLLFTQGYQKLLATTFGVFLLPSIWGVLMAAVSDFYLANQVKGWTVLLGNTWGIDSYAAFGDELMLGASYWGLYLAATFGLATTLAMKISSSAAALATMPAAQGATAEGNLTLGKAGTGAAMRQDVATAEGVAGAANRMADNWAQAQTIANQGHLMDYNTAEGAGKVAGQKAVLSEMGQSGMANAVAGELMSRIVQGASARNAIQNNGGMNNAVDAGTYEQSSRIAQNALRSASTGGDFRKEAQWAVTNDMATRTTFGTAENYQKFLEAQQGKSAGQIAGEMASYGNVRNSIQAAGGDAQSYTWATHNALMSEVKADQEYARTAEFRQQAENLGVNTQQLSSFLEAGRQTREVKEAVQTAGGERRTQQEAASYAADIQRLSPNASRQDYENLASKYALTGGAEAWQKVKAAHENFQANGAAAVMAQAAKNSLAVEQYTPEQRATIARTEGAAAQAGSGDAKQSVVDLQRNLQRGDLQAIQQDKGQSAAFHALTGRSADEVAGMERPQQNQVTQGALDAMKPAGKPAQEQYEKVAQGLRELGGVASTDQHRQFLASAKAEGLLPPSATVQHVKDMHAAVIAADEQGAKILASSMERAPRDMTQTARNVNENLGGFAGDVANGRAGAILNVSQEDRRNVGEVDVKQGVGNADAARIVQNVTGMDAREAAAYTRSHEGQMAIAKFQNMEEFAQRQGHSFMDFAKDSQRSFKLDVGAKEAKSWGLKGGAGSYNVSMGADGKYVFTDQKGGKQYQVGVFGVSGTSVQRVDINKDVYDHRDYHGTGSVTEEGNKKVVDNSTSVKDGTHVDVVAKDGTHTRGVVDRRGNLVDGDISKVVTDRKVENIEGQGAAVVMRQGDAMQRSVAVTARAGKNIDFSNSHKEGTRVESVQNLPGSAANADFTEGSSLDAGKVARGAAVVRGALSETSSIATDVGSLVGAHKMGEGVGPDWRSPYSPPTGIYGEKSGWQSPIAPRKAPSVGPAQGGSSMPAGGGGMPAPVAGAARPQIKAPSVNMGGAPASSVGRGN